MFQCVFLTDRLRLSCITEFVAVFKRRRRPALPGNRPNAVALLEREDQVEVNVDLVFSLRQKAPGGNPGAFCYELCSHRNPAIYQINFSFCRVFRMSCAKEAISRSVLPGSTVSVFEYQMSLPVPASKSLVLKVTTSSRLTIAES